MERVKKLESPDTGYVNLSGLIKYFRQLHFAGRLHLDLNSYMAVRIQPAVFGPFESYLDRIAGTTVLSDL